MISRGCFHRRTPIKGSGLARTAGARFAWHRGQVKLHLSIFFLLSLLVLWLLSSYFLSCLFIDFVTLPSLPFFLQTREINGEGAPSEAGGWW